jgi:NADH-quinone oxidoreductase subunit J
MLDAFFFYAFATLILGGALATILQRNPVHSAISLICSLLGVSGIFLLQGAEFLSVAQIIIYVGGIMVLFLFVIMLADLHRIAKQSSFQKHWKAGVVTLVLAAVGIFSLLPFRSVLLATPASQTSGQPALGNSEAIGTALFQDYLLPFEIASLLLLAALIGSVVMAKKRI